MFQTKWFRMVMVMAVLASLLVAPLLVSAQEAAVESGITAPKADATVSGTVKVTGNATGDVSRWELLLFANGEIKESSKAWLAGGAGAGAVSYDLDTTKYPDGKHALVLRVVKADSNYTDYITPVTFANAAAVPAETPAPAATATVTSTATAPVATPAPAAKPVVENGIASPKADATVSGTVTVTGNVAGDVSRWELLLFANGEIKESSKAWLAGGAGAGAVSYDLDTTKYPDGKHALVLRAVKADSNYTDYVTPVTVANAAAAPVEAPAATAAVTVTKTTTATAAPAPVATPAPAAKPAGEPGITSPKEGATVSGVVKVTGLAPTEGFVRWELLVFPNGNDSKLSTIYVTGGDTLGEFSYDLDTTKLPDGNHVLTLRVVKPDTNYTDYRVNLVVANTPAQ